MMLRYAQLWLSSIAIAALIASASAQTWGETGNGGGDAGDLPGTAQVVSGSGTLTAIIGYLDAHDVDMYAILICDPLNFFATTVGGAAFNTQLFLFRADGTGALHNDNDPGGSGTQSHIGTPNDVYSRGTLINSWSGWASNNLPAGLYYLAISQFDRDPLSAYLFIWADVPYNRQRVPDGANPGGIVDRWIRETTEGGAYTIRLGGACFVPEPASMLVLGAGLAGLLGLRRRKK